MTGRDVLAALTVVTLWGLNFIAVKVALVVFPPLMLSSLRFALVALLTVWFFRPRPGQFRPILLLAVILGCGHFGLLFWGLAGMDAATTAIVTELGVPFSVILAWALHNDRLDMKRALGLVAAFAGVGLLAGEPTLPDLARLLVAVLAMAAWAAANIVIKKMGAIHPMALNGWMGLMAAPMLAAASVATETGQVQAMAAITWPVALGITYTVIGSSLVAYTLWYRLVASHDISRLVPITLLGPVVGVAAGIVGLGETMTWQKLVGGAITVAGVAVVQFAGRTRPQPMTTEPGP